MSNYVSAHVRGSYLTDTSWQSNAFSPYEAEDQSREEDALYLSLWDIVLVYYTDIKCSHCLGLDISVQWSVENIGVLFKEQGISFSENVRPY